MQLELELQSARRPALLIASTSQSAWHGTVSGWFPRAAMYWQSERPGAVVAVPTRGQAQALKARLLEANLSTIGARGSELLEQMKEMIWRATDGNRGKAFGFGGGLLGEDFFCGESEEETQMFAGRSG